MSVAETNTESIRNFMNALEINDLEVAAGYLSEEFIFSGWTPQPLNKADFLRVIGGLKAGIPGLIFNLHNIEEQSNKVHGMIQIVGYQTDSFILPPLGTPPIPQTASSISLPAEEVVFILEQEKITTFHVQHVEGGGIHGLLRQLGFDLTIVQ